MSTPIFFFFQAEDGIRDFHVTGVQTCALPIYSLRSSPRKRGPRLNSPAAKTGSRLRGDERGESRERSHASTTLRAPIPPLHAGDLLQHRTHRRGVVHPVS